MDYVMKKDLDDLDKAIKNLEKVLRNLNLSCDPTNIRYGYDGENYELGRLIRSRTAVELESVSVPSLKKTLNEMREGFNKAYPS